MNVNIVLTSIVAHVVAWPAIDRWTRAVRRSTHRNIPGMSPPLWYIDSGLVLDYLRTTLSGWSVKVVDWTTVGVSSRVCACVLYVVIPSETRIPKAGHTCRAR